MFRLRICFPFLYPSVSSPACVYIMTGLDGVHRGTTEGYVRKAITEKYGTTDWAWSDICVEMLVYPNIQKNSGYSTFHIGKVHFENQESVGANSLYLEFEIN